MAADNPATTPWWSGTVIPTCKFRLKMRGVALPGGTHVITMPGLQQLVRPTGGGRGRWIDVPLAEKEESDDE